MSTHSFDGISARSLQDLACGSVYHSTSKFMTPLLTLVTNYTICKNLFRIEKLELEIRI